MDLSYIINHLGEDRENYLNAGAPPIFQTSNFIFQNSADMRHALAHIRRILKDEIAGLKDRRCACIQIILPVFAEVIDDV